MPLKKWRLGGVYIYSVQDDRGRHVKSKIKFYKKERKRVQLRIWVKASTKAFIRDTAPGSMQAFVEGLIEREYREMRREEMRQAREDRERGVTRQDPQ